MDLLNDPTFFSDDKCGEFWIMGHSVHSKPCGISPSIKLFLNAPCCGIVYGISVKRKVSDQGVIAQLVERLNGIEEVWGSNPHGSKVNRWL